MSTEAEKYQTGNHYRILPFGFPVPLPCQFIEKIEEDIFGQTIESCSIIIIDYCWQYLFGWMDGCLGVWLWMFVGVHFFVCFLNFGILILTDPLLTYFTH